MPCLNCSMEGIGILEIGERVYARSEFIEGFGVIEYIAKGELLPIQMEMEKADENGHKTFRFSLNEISVMETDSVATNLQFDGGFCNLHSLDGEYIAEAKYTSGRFMAGDRHIIGPTKDPRLSEHYNVYFMDHSIVATLKSDIFKIIGPYVAPIPIETKIEIMVPIEKKTYTKPVILEQKAEKVKQKAVSEQLSMFDFI